MNKNPLIPTSTVDKNGRRTTVHKRAEASKPGLATSIPKVVLPAPPQDNCKIIVEFGFESDISAHKMSDNVRAKMMATLHPETLTRMENLLRDHNASVLVFRRATNWCTQNRNFAVLNSLVALTEEAEDKGDMERCLFALMGMQQIREPKTPEIDLTNPDDPRAEGGRALVKAIVAREWSERLVYKSRSKKGHVAVVFVDTGVGNLVMEHPDRADEIIEMYAGGRPFDRGLYEAALENNVQPLNDGVL